MKTPILLGEWSGESAARIREEFAPQAHYDNDVRMGDYLDFWDGAELLLAYYWVDGYEGAAFALFRKGGKLFEVNAAHCSCNGLEDGWPPEETTVEALRYRILNGHLGESDYNARKYAVGDTWENIFKAELTELLDELYPAA